MIRRLAATLVGLVVLSWIGLMVALRLPVESPPPQPRRIAPFSHVFIIMMENRSPQSLNAQETPYIHRLMAEYGVDTRYYGITHVSLPNYVATLSGTTGGTHSDNPTQKFYQPTLVEQLNRHHISWQAVMQSLPKPGYLGNWWPDNLASSTPAVIPPPNALYAKKHDPFLLFPAIARDQRRQVVPLHVLSQELADGKVPRLVWITPDLCHDMHGQALGRGNSCPASQSRRLLQQGDHFLATWIPKIMTSSAWQGSAVIFVTWDESSGPDSLTPGGIIRYLRPGPAAPTFLGIPIGGGRVPLIVIARQRLKPLKVPLWADHYSILKTIEWSWHLKFLGHAASPQVPILSPFFPPSTS